MADDLLLFALAMLAIVLPLLLGWLIVGRPSADRQDRRERQGTPQRIDAAAPPRRPGT